MLLCSCILGTRLCHVPLGQYDGKSLENFLNTYLSRKKEDAGVVELWGEGGYHLKIWQVQDTNKIFLPGIIQLKSDKSDTFTLKVS